MEKFLPLSKKELSTAFVVFVAYFIVAKISLYIYFVFQTSPALIWPPVGLALAVMLVGGYRMWIPVFLAQFAATLTQFPSGELFLLFGIFVFAVAYTFQAAAGLYILNKLKFQTDLEKVRNVLTLIIMAFLITMIEPTITTVFQSYGGIIEGRALFVWGRSWGAGIFSVLVFTPFLLTWYKFDKSFFPARFKFRIELLAAFALLIVANYVVLWSDGAQFLGITVIFIIPAVLIWFALRLHPRWLSLAVFITAVQGVSGALFSTPSDQPISEQLLSVQLYIGLVAAIFYVFAAVVDERRAAFYKLEKAYEAAAASDKAKNEFIAILAHELRNPLAPVISSLELLKFQQLSPESKSIVEGAQEHTVMMRRLLDDLLDIARLGQSKIKLQKETVSLKQVVEQSVSSVHEKAENLHHKIDVEMPSGDFSFYADPVRIKQIIINLLNNALKYTHPGGRISLQCFKENDQLVIKVIDTGIGIEKEKLEHIFEPFKQLGNVSRYSSGLGIGLFLTKELVELHGGKIEAQSEGLNKGSKFTVHIPLMQNTDLQENPKELPQQADATEKNSKILIVDDNEAAANILQKLLKLHGYKVDVSYSGTDAVEKIKKLNPNIVFLDIGMPDVDGYEVARRVRMTSWNGSIIALSGFGQESDKGRSLKAGFSHHLVKPAGIADILAIIETFTADTATKH